MAIQGKTNFSVKRNWLALFCETVYESPRDDHTNVQILPKSFHFCKKNSEY